MGSDVTRRLTYAALAALAVVLFVAGTASAAKKPADQTNQVLAIIAAAADGTTINFGHASYRIEGTIEVAGRNNLTLVGGTFTSQTAPDDQRAMWRWVGSTGITMRNMTLTGSYANGGTFNAGLQHAHGIDARGANLTVEGVTISNMAGDGVYYGLGYDSTTQSSGTVSGTTIVATGRNGVSITAGHDITISDNSFDRVGYETVDLEPNTVSGNWGTANTSVHNNTIGSFYLYAFSVVGGPNANASFADNTATGRLRMAVVDPGSTGRRPTSISFTGNIAGGAATPPAVEVNNTDGITVTGNTLPLTGGVMCTVANSANVNVSGNSYPGGTAEVVVS